MALLGGDTVRARILLGEIKDMNVPAILGGDLGRVTDMMPMALAADIVQKVVPSAQVPTPIPQRPSAETDDAPER